MYYNKYIGTFGNEFKNREVFPTPLFAMHPYIEIHFDFPFRGYTKIQPQTFKMCDMWETKKEDSPGIEK